MMSSFSRVAHLLRSVRRSLRNAITKCVSGEQLRYQEMSGSNNSPYPFDWLIDENQDAPENLDEVADTCLSNPIQCTTDDESARELVTGWKKTYLGGEMRLILKVKLEVLPVHDEN